MKFLWRCDMGKINFKVIMKNKNQQPKKQDKKSAPKYLRGMVIGKTPGEIKKNTHDILMEMRYGK